MKLTLKIWRQPTADAPGKFETHHVTDANPEMTILELLDRLNNTLVSRGVEPVAFESDCREGICGTCGITVNGRPHGPAPNWRALARARASGPGLNRYLTAAESRAAMLRADA